MNDTPLDKTVVVGHDEELELYSVAVKYTERVSQEIVMDARDPEDAARKVKEVLSSNDNAEILSVEVFNVVEFAKQKALKDKLQAEYIAQMMDMYEKDEANEDAKDDVIIDESKSKLN